MGRPWENHSKKFAPAGTTITNTPTKNEGKPPHKLLTTRGTPHLQLGIFYDNPNKIFFFLQANFLSISKKERNNLKNDNSGITGPRNDGKGRG